MALTLKKKKFQKNVFFQSLISNSGLWYLQKVKYRKLGGGWKEKLSGRKILGEKWRWPGQAKLIFRTKNFDNVEHRDEVLQIVYYTISRKTKKTNLYQSN